MRLSWSRAEDGVVTVYGTSSDGRICEIADFWLKPMVDRFGATRATALDWQQQAAEVLVNNWNRLFTAANIPVTQIPPLEAAVVSLTLENAKLRDALAERQEITMTAQDTYLNHAKQPYGKHYSECVARFEEGFLRDGVCADAPAAFVRAVKTCEKLIGVIKRA